MKQDIHKIMPQDKCRPFTDSSGKRWFDIGDGAWLSEEDVDADIGQYDLMDLGFSTFEERPIFDMTKSLHGGWIKDGFTRIAEWVRPERGIREKRVSDYYKALLQKMDSNNSGDLSGDELRHAVNYEELDVRDIVARMVVRHDSEWFGGSSHHRWRAFLTQLDPLCVSYVRKWFDDMEWMSQVEGFSRGEPVWHMHPVVFLDSINDKTFCACNRNITIDELCLIAPKAKKELLEQYISAFNDGFGEFQITTCREKAHFLAQCCHESGGLQLTKEIGGAYKNYAPWFGRGLIQLTWQDVYVRYGEYVGEDFISNDAARNKVAEYPHCVKSAFWFYCINKKISKYAKLDDFNMVTALINGGFNGYIERLKYFKNAVGVLNAEHLSSKMIDSVFLFEDSEIYNYRVYAYSWGRYHDPLQVRLVGTDKNKSEALKAYQRALTLYQNKNDMRKVNAINEKLDALR
ncbi:hypothetical protein [Shimwellia blattae]|uniref:EF-hand domain-containing protein n=1 Tax=Shimwellia blattae (strain ATCC 29907 / DSM 4481 / JCM 1650 / NBRC 105725 / CDC 9005-74) TaxID=630626 RepID=I2B6X3_SHIBC|nr:hypothetical protein [Shimwellia blattae]AFJ46277.1 hypothetical protein EBL_c11730 [Shimwellia blattae DSM 4481 = NBRC 105725]VDY63742.1 Predicted chitinase [Shimwellia blattae]VEC21884.1 Predicted chitinase [Shimwellia blattae]